MKKVLVTGGFGFIGSELVSQLINKHKYEVVVVDNMSSSKLDIDDYLDQIQYKDKLIYHLISVAEFFERGFVDNYTFEEIYHLASPVGPAGVLKHAGNMIRQVVNDTYLIADYCIMNSCLLVDVSTSEIYGGGQSGYCPENTNKIVPANTTVRLEYAIAKLAMETALINQTKSKGLLCVIVRPFNVAGPRQSPEGGFVLPRFIIQAHLNKDITIFGTGEALRAFTHVEDMANGIVLAAKNGRSGEAYNIGNPSNRTTILSLAEKVKSVLKSDSELTFVDPKTIYGDYYEEASDKYPDAVKAKKELGWEPVHSIESTIRSAFEEYLRQLKKGLIKAKI